MLSTSHYDKTKADRAVTFIENLYHTKGKWAGKKFWLLPWQEQLIRDIFGIVQPDGNRQFRTAFVEICKKVGKSELAAAIVLYLLYADNEPEATSSIDTRTEALVQDGMDKLMKGRTVFVIAHRLSTVQNSDVIMVLNHGHIIERGNHDKLIAEKGAYYQLYTGAFELE